MQSAFIITDNKKNPYAVISILAGGSEFYPLSENAKSWAKWMAADFSDRKVSKAELVQTLDSSLSVEGPLPANRTNKVKIEELIKNISPVKFADRQKIELDKKSLGFNIEENFMLPTISIMDIQINDLTNSEWKNGVNFKSMSFLADSNKSTFTYEVKRTRAVWDPSLAVPGTERRGGFRCPVGTRYGGQITDRFGRNCGWGVARRLANQLTDVGESLEDISDARRNRRVDRRNARMVRRLNKPAKLTTEDTALNTAINSYVRRGQPTPGSVTPAIPTTPTTPRTATPRTPSTARTPRTPGTMPIWSPPSPRPGEPGYVPTPDLTPYPPPSGRPGYPSRPIDETPTPKKPGSKPKPATPKPARPRRPRKPSEVRPKPESGTTSKPVALPKDVTPNDNETLEDFKDRKYGEHQRRIREMQDRGEDVGLLRRSEWEKTHGAAVEQEWNSRQAKPAKPSKKPVDSVPLPNINPQASESLDDFKTRKYNEHQRRVREAIARGEEAGLLNRSEWEEFHGPTVEKEWNLRQGRNVPEKPQKNIPKDLTSKVPVPEGAPAAVETLEEYKDRKYNEHQRRVREIIARGGEAGYLNREEWETYHGPAVEQAYAKARERVPGRAERRVTAEERGSSSSSRKPKDTDIPDAVQPPKKKKTPKAKPASDELPQGWNAGPGTIITHENNDIIDQEPVGGKWFVVTDDLTLTNFDSREQAIAWHKQNILDAEDAPSEVANLDAPKPGDGTLGEKWGFGAVRKKDRDPAFDNMGAADENGNSIVARLTKQDSAIKTKAQAVEHVKNGGSLAEVPDEFLAIALSGNSAKIRDIITPSIQTEIRNQLTLAGLDPEKGWHADMLIETSMLAYLQSIDPSQELPEDLIQAIGDSKFIEVKSGSAAAPSLYFGVVDGRIVQQGYVVKTPDAAMARSYGIHDGAIELIGTEVAQMFGFAQEAGRRDGKIRGKPAIVLPFIHNATESRVLPQPFDPSSTSPDEELMLNLFNFGIYNWDGHAMNNFVTADGHVSPVDFGRNGVIAADDHIDVERIGEMTPRNFRRGGMQTNQFWSDLSRSETYLQGKYGSDTGPRVANLFRERVAAIDWDAMRARHAAVWSGNEAETVAAREYAVAAITAMEKRLKELSEMLGENDSGGFFDWSLR